MQSGSGTNAGATSSPYAVHWHQSNPDPNAQYNTIYSYVAPGGCYGLTGHTHNRLGCEKHELYKTSGAHSGSSIGDCPICGRGLEGWWQDNGEWAEEGTTTWACSGGDCDHRNNTWELTCGYTHGQIIGAGAAAVPGQCYFAPGYQPSATLTHQGNGHFSLRLAEQDGLYYLNNVARTNYYLNDRANLVLLENTVVYYKRF